MYRQLKETWEEMTGPGQPFEVTKVNVRGLELNAFASAPNSLRDIWLCLLYTSPSPRDRQKSRMPSSA